MRSGIIPPNAQLLFADFFKFNILAEDVANHFGYHFNVTDLDLPQSPDPVTWYPDLAQRITESLPLVSLTTEAARREFLIAPILIDLARFMQIKVRIEYPIKVSDQLQGTLDYYVANANQLLIIEAKNADLERGFNQLVAELIAIDQWTDAPSAKLYGAVSIGNVWQFGVLDRQQKIITQDVSLYRVPADLNELLQILIAILTPDS